MAWPLIAYEGETEQKQWFFFFSSGFTKYSGPFTFCTHTVDVRRESPLLSLQRCAHCWTFYSPSAVSTHHVSVWLVSLYSLLHEIHFLRVLCKQEEDGKNQTCIKLDSHSFNESSLIKPEFKQAIKSNKNIHSWPLYDQFGGRPVCWDRQRLWRRRLRHVKLIVSYQYDRVWTSAGRRFHMWHSTAGTSCKERGEDILPPGTKMRN